MQNFLNTTLCRKKYILEYFGESYNKCNNCDNCIQIIEDNTKIKQDIQYPVYLFLKLISTTKTSMGIGKLITILSGKKDVKVKDYYIYFHIHCLVL
jgi:ATP-dependent DNA helicase RecQ